MSSIDHLLDELRLVLCSLLAGESISFAEHALEWQTLVDSESDEPLLAPSTACRFDVRVTGAPVWLDIELPKTYPKQAKPIVYVKAENVNRDVQEKWNSIVESTLAEIGDVQYPVFELLSIVLPRLHEIQLKNSPCSVASLSASPSAPENIIYHALLTSHHLKSPNKRRSMQKWASELSLRGFAKVGYPGVMYCEGEQRNVEEFVANVKAMQWLALRVRFVEPLPLPKRVDLQSDAPTSSVSKFNTDSRRWTELEKVGEVVDYMRRIGREEYVIEMGLGSAGTSDVK